MHTVIMVTDWLKPDTPAQYYFLKELLSLRSQIRLRPYTSTVLGFAICSIDGDQFVMAAAPPLPIEMFFFLIAPETI